MSQAIDAVGVGWQQWTGARGGTGGNALNEWNRCRPWALWSSETHTHTHTQTRGPHVSTQSSITHISGSQRPFIPIITNSSQVTPTFLLEAASGVASQFPEYYIITMYLYYHNVFILSQCFVFKDSPPFNPTW